MTFDIKCLIENNQGQNYELHKEYINPQFAKVLKTIGFDHVYTTGKGQYLYDDKNNKYLDCLAGYGVFNVGRNHPVIKQALHDFLDSEHAALVQMEAPLLSGLLAKELVARTPDNLERVYFTSSGTEGVETAIKFAHCATKRSKILYCYHAFHGLTNGSLSINGSQSFKNGFEPLLPDCITIQLNDINELEEKLKHEDVAAFILEPILGKGVFVADNDYLENTARLCKKYGTLLVLDEVQTGLGRTGKLFAYEYANVTPDILIISKALSGGFVPVGAVITTKAIYEEVFSSMERCVIHSSTFGQGAMAMTAGLAYLHVLDEENIIQNAYDIGELLISGLKEISNKYEMIKEVRGKGLMIGIEFDRPKSLKLRMGWDLAHKVAPGLFGQAIVMPLLSDHKILTQVAGPNQDIIKLIPPLTITKDDVEWFITAFDDVMRRNHKIGGPMWQVASKVTKSAIKRR